MQNVFKLIVFIGDLFGVVLFIITYLGLKKMLKELSKLNDDDFLSEMERKKCNQYIIYMIIGFSISVITSLINLILLFFNNPF